MQKEHNIYNNELLNGILEAEYQAMANNFQSQFQEDNTMKNVFILNIGLNTSKNYTEQEEQLSVEQVLNEIKDCFLEIESYKLEKSSTEKTIAATVKPLIGDCVFTEVELLAERLMQDCIACYSVADQAGVLIGEYAKDWGVFDSKYFLI